MFLAGYLAREIPKRAFSGFSIEIRDKYVHLMGKLVSAVDDGEEVCFRVDIGDPDRVSVIWTKATAMVYVVIPEFEDRDRFI